MKRNVYLITGVSVAAVLLAATWPKWWNLLLPRRTSMSAVEVVLRLVLAAGLGSFLYIKHHQRLSRLPVQYDPAEWTGKAIDAKQLKPILEDVRHNYLAGPKSPSRSCYHAALLELARQAIVRLAYFRHKD